MKPVITFDSLEIWSRNTSELGHAYPSDNLQARLAEAVIAGIEEIEYPQVTLSALFGKSKGNQIVSTTRGVFMVLVFKFFRDNGLCNVTRASVIASGLFGRDRASLFHFLRKEDGGGDRFYEVFQTAPFAQRAKFHLHTFLEEVKKKPKKVAVLV